MQAWKIKYSQTQHPDKRWTAGILAVSKEDALKHLNTVTKFPYQVENIEYLGEIHAITEPILMSVVKARQATQQPPKQPEKTVKEVKENAAKIEDEIQNGEVECQYCGKVCKGKVALEKHEASCKHNPSKQDKKKEENQEKDQSDEELLNALNNL